jgi:hypothetical protein
MRISRKAAAGVATLALAAGLGLGAIPASASTRATVVYAAGPFAGAWRGPQVRPHTIYLGADYWLDQMGWHTWSHGSAHGYGRSNAAAGAGYPLQRYRVTATLSDVRYHGSQPYFEKLVLTAPHHATVVRWAGNGEL